MIYKIKEETSISLDFFRGVSAQLVLAGHLLSFFGWQEEYRIPIIQNFGVLVFFVLSGFLIVQTTLLKGRDYGFKNYFIDRFSRIQFSFIPALFLIIIIDELIRKFGVYNPSYNFQPLNLVANLFQLQAYPFINSAGIEAYGSARPLWTVSVEAWLYVTFGFIYYNIYLKSKPNFWQTGLFLLSLPLAFYYIVSRGDGLSIVWFLGFVLAVLHNRLSIKTNSLYFMIILICLLCGMGYRMYFFPEMYDMGIAIIFSGMIYLFFNTPVRIKNLLLNKNVAAFSKFIASFSYSLYLIHYSLIELCLTFLKELSLGNFILIFITINILSFLFYLLFEKKNVLFRKFLKNKLA